MRRDRESVHSRNDGASDDAVANAAAEHTLELEQQGDGDGLPEGGSNVAERTAAADAPTGTAGTTGSAAPTTSGTAGTTAATPTEPKFILTAATLVPADSTGAASASATPGASSTAGTCGASATSSAPGTPSAASASSTAGASATAQTYRLIANPAALTAHVGKKLELTGAIDTTSTANPKEEGGFRQRPAGAAGRIGRDRRRVVL